MNKIITISRQYGSGGREIGEKLAKALQIPFYDKELIAREAKESGFAKEVLENAEDRVTSSFLYSVAMGMNVYGNQEFGTPILSLDDQIYLVQTEVIQKIASEGPCVIIGRCADAILKEYTNVINFYIWASLESRIKRAINEYHLPEKKAKEAVMKIDKRRANYYHYHTNERWGKAENYHLCLQSDFLGIERTVKCMQLFMEQ